MELRRVCLRQRDVGREERIKRVRIWEGQIKTSEATEKISDIYLKKKKTRLSLDYLNPPAII